MDEPAPMTGPDVTPSWRQEPRGHPDEVQARRLKSKTWTLFAVLAVALGALLGLASSFRSRPYPAFLPIVVGGIQESGGAVAFADADLAALARRGLFARTIGDPAPLGPTETITRRLDRLGEVSPRESLVVFLVAPARVGPGGVIEILGTGAKGDGPDRWMALREILAKVSACPARNRLVVLDVMRPMADPIEGILADDVAARIGQTLDLAAPASQELFVLSACGAGQLSWASEELGRSVFGLAVEEGLRGLADSEGGDGDGRVTVRELARYVTRRTHAWVWHNRQARQTPVLLEKGGSRDRPSDFALAPRNRVEPAARQEAVEPVARSYPDWLKAAWARRDGMVADGTARLVPRALRLMNATLLAAEQDWRAGVDPIQIQSRVEAELTELARQFARVKSEQRLPLRSLALEESQGRVADPAVKAAMGDLLKKRARPAIGLKPEEAAVAEAKLLADFQAATQDKPDFDVASTVFAAAADTLVPVPQAILSLEGLLRSRQPTAGWVEILTLHRLAERAEAIVQGKLPAGAWKPATVRKLLDVVRQGERAHARAESPGWVRPWLDAAAEARHLGEVAFDAVGYVPPDQAGGHLDRAADLYTAVVAAQDRFQSAVRLRDEALDLLPDFLPYLDHAPELFPAWSDALHAAEVLDAATAVSPAEMKSAASAETTGQTPGLEVLRAASDRIDRLSAELKSPLDRLRSPFQSEAVSGLLARAKEAKADSVTWRAIAALLDTPHATADQRASLWSAAHELAERLDRATPSDVPFPSVAGEGGAEVPSVVLARSLARRATEAVGLLKLAGLEAEKARTFEDEILRITKASGDDSRSVPPNHEIDWPQFGAALHHAWAELIDATDHGDVAMRSRLVRILPGAIRATPLDLGLDDPVAEARRQNARALQAWLADWFRYVGTDQGIDFFLVAAQEYRRGVESLTLHPTAAWSGPVQPPVLGENQPHVSLDLTLELKAESAGTGSGTSPNERAKLSPIMVRVLQPVRDWLGVSLDAGQGLNMGDAAQVLMGPGSGQYVIKPVQAGSIPLRLRLTARDTGGETPRAPEPQAPPPAGILIQAEVQGRVFSRTVPVVVRSPADVFRIILGDEVQDQAGARKVMKLRPLPGRQRVPLRMKNPTASARDVIIELRRVPDDSGPVVVTPRMTIAALATQPVAFTLPASRGGAAKAGPATGTSTGPAAGPGLSPVPGAGGSIPLAELEGPLEFRVLDAQSPEVVLGQRVVMVEVANPADYVRVQDASLTPPRPVAKEPNRLSVSLRSLLPPSDPAAAIELVLRQERIPGLLGVEKGVLRGKLPAGGDLKLTAEAINLDPAVAAEGVIEVTVDGVERALLLRAAFTGNRDLSIPLNEEAVALRLRSPAMARTGSPVPVVLEVDNGPEGAALELSLGRTLSGRFEPIQTWRYRGARRARIGVDPAPPGGGLEFEASLGDWSQMLDTGGLRGRFPLRARLRRGDGLILKEVEREILLDDQRPRWINLVGLPRRAKRGRTLGVTAIGESPPSGISSAQFFIGRPGPDGKMPAGVAPVPGIPQPGKTERWKAELKLPADKGDSEAAISVRFVTGVGLDALGTASIELADTDPVATGTVRGVVREGSLAQKDLVVGLFDAKGNKLREARTSETGWFRFEDLTPGIYFLTCGRPVAATRGQAKAEVKADRTAEVTISLFR